MADNSSVEAYLIKFRNFIRENGGDYEIILVEHPNVHLKIRGKKNKPRSRENLKVLVEYALKKKYPEDKWSVEMTEWIVPDPDGRIKTTFKNVNNKIKGLFNKGGE